MVRNHTPSGDDRALDDRERAVHALSRLAFGPRPGQVEHVMSTGVLTWIDDQLEARPLSPSSLVKRLDQSKTLYSTPAEIKAFADPPASDDETVKQRRERARLRSTPNRELAQAVLLRATLSDRQGGEVLADFWRNHLNVSFTKGWPAGMYLPDYEQVVIREHALGDFPAMLSASAHHAAMMHYLDNQFSRRPPSKQELAKLERKVRRETGSAERGEEAAAIATLRGVNENYARELMELHTLGVDRTYRQKDVIAVAEALTGWGVASGKDGYYGFEFDHARHINDDQRFLGYILRQDKEDGPGQGERVLKILGDHKHTAEFISHKLVRYLVNDVPPPALVRSVSATYKKTSGEIPAMVRTVVESKEFWDRRNYRAKFKTPQEFVISALRVTGAKIAHMSDIFQVLSDMGQPTYHCDDPTGYYDTAEAWLDPGVMAKRWEFALALAEGDVGGVRVPDSFFGEITDEHTPLQWMREMVEKILPGGSSTRTQALLYDVIRKHTANSADPEMRVLGPRVVGLLLGSPEFQQQ